MGRSEGRASGARKENDFTKGSMAANIMSLAVPMMLAQVINVLYSVIDRIYIGQIPEAGTLALTGVGVAFPIISMISAFTNLFGNGGAPLCSIARGRGDDEEAERVMGNSFTLLMLAGAALIFVGLLVKRPVLYLFGASDATIGYADSYITIYLCGTLFVMAGLGMNGFINAQGFGKMGMMTVLLGAVVNIILDPIFIFVLKMGVAGAALATVISQFLSAVWVIRFLTGKRAILRLKRKNLKLSARLVQKITGLGLSGFVMAFTNSAVQIVNNTMLQRYGGDLYVGVMTVINTVREMLSMPVSGLTGGAQPVLGYNYGAGEGRRVKKGILFMSLACVGYTVLVWLILLMNPELFLRLFNKDPELLAAGGQAMRIYFFGFFMMSLQFAGQSVFVGLGKSKQAVFFSLLRKAVIVIPLALLLPSVFGLGVDGIFLAEPISDYIGGIACFVTMLFTVWRKLEDKNSEPVR